MDKSFKSDDGRFLHMGTTDFIDLIGEGDACFICGALPSTKAFNDEHVIPDWVLRAAKMQQRTITLPNGASRKYSQYKIPCCEECNSLLSRKIEQPVSQLLKSGVRATSEALASDHDAVWSIFRWMCLIFVKTHLADRHFRFHLDARLGSERIAEMYDWSLLHHAHCIVRTVYTNAVIETPVLGSCLVLGASTEGETFDYSDLYEYQTVLFRLDDLAIISVINDTCQVLGMIGPTLERIDPPLNPIQVREMFARVAYGNALLQPRPRFYTRFLDPPELAVLTPERREQCEVDHERLGALIDFCCGEMLERSNTPDKAKIREGVRKGERTFLWTDE
jgi:hypothetical protein